MSLQRQSRINIRFPNVIHRPSSVLRSEEFVPVIPLRRYNLLKLKEIYCMKEKDKRLGRMSTEGMSLISKLRADRTAK